MSTQKSVAHPVTMSRVHPVLVEHLRQLRPVEGIARALVHHEVAGAALEGRQEPPALVPGSKVAGRPVVLDEDDDPARPADRPRELR